MVGLRGSLARGADEFLCGFGHGCPGDRAAVGKPNAARNSGPGREGDGDHRREIAAQLGGVEGDVGAVPSGGVEGEAVTDRIARARGDGRGALLLGRVGSAVELQQEEADHGGGGGRERPQDPEAGTERVHGRRRVSPLACGVLSGC